MILILMLGTANVRLAAMRERRNAEQADRTIHRVHAGMTTRIDKRFAALKAEGRAALVTFLTAGDPDAETSLAIVKALPGAGADVIELGMPFTDPMADGPAIQAAGLRALNAGQTMVKTLALVRDFRKGDDATPIVLMGYYNPIYIYGVEKFLVDAKVAGVDGLIIVDLPPEEDDELCLPALKAGLQLHPARDADNRRQASAGRAGEHVGLRLLRVDHRHHGRGRSGPVEGQGRGRAHQAPHETTRRGRLRRAQCRTGARDRRRRGRRGGRHGAGGSGAPRASMSPARRPPPP